MEQFALSYRDPLLGIILFVFLIFSISLISYFLGLLKEKFDKNTIETFLETYDYDKEAKNLADIVKSTQHGINALILLADGYAKSGEFNKAVTLYIALLDTRKLKKNDSVSLLNRLGSVYYKAGFLERSKETFLRSVRLQPRNTVALRYLTALFEQTGAYDEAYETIRVLGELGQNTIHEQSYIQTLLLLQKATSFDDILPIIPLITQAPFIERMVIEWAIRKKIILPSTFTPQHDARYVDILWLVPLSLWETLQIHTPLLEDIRAIKTLSSHSHESQIFELTLLLQLPSFSSSIDLEFEFVCDACKSTEPLYATRCRRCLALGQSRVIPKLTPKITSFQGY